nr:hypothetical protein [Tanacetum cinerariifolium]
EELLALSERMGNLKTKTFSSSTPSQTEDQKPSDEKPSFCVICQGTTLYDSGTPCKSYRAASVSAMSVVMEGGEA